VNQHPEPAPYGATAAYGGGSAPPRRRRPRAAWLALGAALLVGGLALAVPALALSISALTQVDARLPADGVARTVRVEAGAEHLLWARPGERPACVVVDGVARTELPLGEPGPTTYTRDRGDGEWVGVATFTPPSRSVEVTCSPGSATGVEVGERPRVRTLVGGVLLGLVLPVLAAVAGLVTLVVVTVLIATAAPRHPRRDS
jgi:hypothetical protein